MTTQPPEPPPYGYGATGYPQQSHGGAIAALVCGILSITSCCFPIGIVAWVIGKKAEREIQESQGRYSGDGMARAGWITGIIGTVLSLLLVLFYVGIFGVALIADSNNW